MLFTCELCLGVNSFLLYFILQISGFPCFFFILTHCAYTPPLPSPVSSSLPSLLMKENMVEKQNQLLGTDVLLIYLKQSSQYLFDKHDLT